MTVFSKGKKMTTETLAPFQPIAPIGSTLPAANTVERPARKKKDKAVAALKEKKPKVAKPAKKAKKAAAPKTKGDTISVSLKDFATMRAGDHAKLFLKVHKLLAGESKAARKVVLAEIAKVLA